MATIKTPGMSQYRDMYFLTEDGLYEVLMMLSSVDDDEKLREAIFTSGQS